MSSDELAGVRAHLAANGRPVATTSRLGAMNNNNRLFRLDLVDGPPLVAKLYYRDGRRRMEREHDTLAYLAAHDFPNVPRPIARDDEAYWAVYTFEPGTTRNPAQLSADDVRALARFAADLHRFGHSDELEPAGWMRAAADLPARIDAEMAHRLSIVSPELRAEVEPAARHVREAALAYAPPPPDDWRLNHGDFAPQNLLFEGPRLAVLDWEAAGWDDPARLVLDFLLHEATRGLPRPHETLFLETYFAVHPDQDLARWRRVYRLLQVGWALGFLNAFDPAVVERKRFANPDLDVAAYQEGQMAKLRARLERVVDSPPDPL
jgi:aminoglycoside phosphotransferase (APT) family kinase protein